MSSTAHTLSPAESPAGRARYHDPENFFAFAWTPVPRRQFLRERDRALTPEAPTAEVPLDAADALGTAYPATTPTLLARYLRIRGGERLQARRSASAEILYVVRGSGTSTGAGERIEWGRGDVMCFPGGGAVTHRARSEAVLFTVTNEPLLAFEALRPAAAGEHAKVLPVHWPQPEIERRFAAIVARPDSEQTAGRALQLAAQQMEPARHPVPSMNVAINTLEPGGDQRPHRHNGAAITLAIQGEGVYSMIEGERIGWADGAAQITPGAELHSHHNRGPRRMESLVIQDEGLHFYTRTPGFSWD